MGDIPREKRTPGKGRERAEPGAEPECTKRKTSDRRKELDDPRTAKMDLDIRGSTADHKRLNPKKNGWVTAEGALAIRYGRSRNCSTRQPLDVVVTSKIASPLGLSLIHI